MRIGQFAALLHTTKDTVRHYEDMGLLQPSWQHGYKVYTDKEQMDFQVIAELKSFGLSLKDIKLLFDFKQAYGCRNRELMEKVMGELKRHAQELQEEEVLIRQRREQLEEQINDLQQVMDK